jgi:putative transposase
MNWAHAPRHWQFGPGVYIVTAGTYGKIHHLRLDDRKDFVLEALFACALEFKWELRAWAVLSNHYHFLANAIESSAPIKRLVGKLHMTTSKTLNEWDNTPGRKVWFQYWDTRITFEKSYLARLRYVNFNPVLHKVTNLAENYRWCSASWFNRTATPAFIQTVNSFQIDQVNVPDDF